MFRSLDAGLLRGRGPQRGLLAALAQGPSVTALVPAIGYDLSAKLAKQALAEDRPLREVVKAAAVLPDDEVDRILDNRKMTEGGVR